MTIEDLEKAKALQVAINQNKYFLQELEKKQNNNDRVNSVEIYNLTEKEVNFIYSYLRMKREDETREIETMFESL